MRILLSYSGRPHYTDQVRRCDPRRLISSWRSRLSSRKMATHNVTLVNVSASAALNCRSCGSNWPPKEMN